MRLFVVVAALLSFVLSTAARGEERVALVVANSGYAGAPALATAASSANLVAASLERAGFRVRLVNDANRNDLALALVDFSLALTADSIGLFYYVGYAAQANGSNFLLPSDAVIAGPADMSAAGVPLNGVLNLLAASGASKIVILDTGWDEDLAHAGVERGLAPVAAPAGTIVAISTQPGTTAADGNGAVSAYAEAFASALGESGLDAHLVLANVRQRVMELTGGRQVPSEVGSFSSNAPVLNRGEVAAGEAPVEPVFPGSAAPPVPEPGEQVAELPPPPPPDAPLPEPPPLLPPTFSEPSGGGGGFSDPYWPGDVYTYTGPDSGSSGGDYWGPAPGSTADAIEMQRYEAEMARRYQEEQAVRERYEAALRAEEQARMEAAMRAAAEAAQAQNNLGEAYESPPAAEAEPPPPTPPESRPPIVPGGGDGIVAEVPVGGADVPSRPTDGEIRPGGGDGAVDDIAPGSGGNFYAMLGAYSEADAWAIVSHANEADAYLHFLSIFPASEHFADAARRYAEMTGAPAAAGEPTTEAAVLPGVQAPAGEEEVAAEEPAPAPPAETKLVRHPTLDAPESVVAEEIFTVSVALTEEQLTPEVTARAAPTTTLTTEGALEFSLPATTEEWTIDIDLLAAGFDLADGGKWSRPVMLYRAGDSDFARFEIKARKIADPSKPRQLMARFYHAGRFLGSVSRPVTVMREAAPPPEEAHAPPGAAMMSLAGLPPPEPMESELVVGDAADVPDLDVTIHYDDPDNLGAGLIVLHSPHIAGPVSAEFTTPAGMDAWLNTEYLRLVQLGLRMRGAEPLPGTTGAEQPPRDSESDKRFVAKVAEGFGDDLYRNYVPQAFKDVFWSLKLRGLLHSIQITSNSPVLPWELVRPQNAEGAQSDGFLGISYRLARWAPRAAASQVDQPLNRLPFTGVAAVAPSYENNQELPFQQVELDALSKLVGFRLIGGDFSSFERMVGEVSTGFIHFSGHGEVNDLGTGSPVFAIRLADQLLDPGTWRALTFAPRDQGNPFYFFNACDTGRAASLGGFVQGWGPAVLASGASGFIGGMWPLTDRTAASFSTEFYGGLTGHLSDGPVYLAEVLQRVRQRFYETGDPTYLAYTFYGNANLKVFAQ